MIIVLSKYTIIVFYLFVIIALVVPFLQNTNKKILSYSAIPLFQLMAFFSIGLTFLFLINYNNILDTINIEYLQAIQNNNN